MLKFILSHLDLVAVCALSCVHILITILKKNKVIITDTAYEKVLALLPKFIIEAEALNNGDNKKLYVLGAALSFLEALTGLDMEELRQKYIEKLSQDIENILQTPQKKEVK